MPDFKVFQQAVDKQFKRMQGYPLYRVSVEKDELWDTYLSSFPKGSNPMLRERTQHDCQCCKSFIRTMGNVVAIINNQLESIWDVEIPGLISNTCYQVVADALAALVKSSPVDNIFLHTESSVGVAENYQQTPVEVVSWNHFYLKVPTANILKGADIGPRLSVSRSSKDVMLRGLTELKGREIDTILELIAQNSLYRGEEHKFVLTEFRKLKKEFIKLDSETEKDIFCWSRVGTMPESVTRIRNTVIGGLLQDLSDGVELEQAVKSFEQKVAPANYKRPTALVTKVMVEKAQKTIEDLGLTSALERRYATINDITINNILFADRSAKKKLKGGVFEDIAAAVPEKTKSLDKVEEISIDDFIKNVLPTATTMELMVENKHKSNLVSLVAPVDPEATQMFKWPNQFSWSYAGEMADSIKERVKQAGGSIEGDLCCRLAWEYTDDLDFYMKEPNGNTIYYGVRRQLSTSGGMLDVDANGADGPVPHPVENIFYRDKSKMREGTYTLSVNNYNRRSDGVGFEVEIEFGDVTHSFIYDRVLRSNDTIEVALIKYSKKDGFEIIKSLPSTQTVKDLWNIPSQSFHRVNVMMMSPNHWDEMAVGNKHYFFMLDGCVNDGKARGFFNEFLSSELDAHRKVLEIVGSRMKTEESSNQLSGLGFSSTQRNSVLCRVTGSFTRVVKIVF